MEIVVQSVATQGYTSNNTGGPGWQFACNVAKPSGLSVGDLMIAHISFQSVSSGDASASGWTQITVSRTDSHSLHTLYKIATSGDVAAGSFTINVLYYNTSSIFYATSTLRITGFNSSTPIQTSATATVTGLTSTPSFGNTITPSNANSMLVLSANTGGTGGTTGFSNWAIATSNPSWTEQVDIADSGSGYNYHLGVATAVRTQTTATGNSSVTGQSSDRWNGIIFAINEYVAVGPANLKTYNTNVMANIKTINTNLIANVKTLDTNA